jgi:uncharacterized membrane protein
MKTRELLKMDWLAWLLMLLPFAVLAAIWNRLPDELPMHWNIHGEADRYGAKGFEVFLLPIISVGIYLLLLAVPRIDPKRQTEDSQKAVRAFRHIIPLVMTAIFGIMAMSWLGFTFEITNVMLLLCAGLFLVIGNFLGAVKPNYFIGIRTPWTLESDENWRKTHRLGGKLWVFGSLALILLWFVMPTKAYIWAFVAGTLALAFVPVIYSYLLYREEKNATQNQA